MRTKKRPIDALIPGLRDADEDEWINDTTLVATRRSLFTGDLSTMTIKVARTDYEKYENGASINAVMPYLSAGTREFIMNGITPDEWDQAFPLEEEDGF